MRLTVPERAVADSRREGDRIGPQWIGTVAASSLRYGLVVVLVWIGGMKFTSYEAEGIVPFVRNSPLLGWVYSVLTVRTLSALLGVVEISVGLMIACRPVSAGVAAFGGALATIMFLTTLSFLLTTPGVWEISAGGFPALSVVPGQFLIKDIVLLGASLWSLADAADARSGPWTRGATVAVERSR